VTADLPGWVHDPDDTCKRACCGPTLPVTGRDTEQEQLADMLVRCGIERGQLGRIDADNVARILLPVVDRIKREFAAAELKRLVDERTWTTEHDNEVVSARDLYEQIARLRGELEPVTYDFPPDEAGDAAALRASDGAGTT
jgi:hypothetical protein